MNVLGIISSLALVYMAIVAETVMGPVLSIHGVSPDWCSLLVMIWLLHARSSQPVILAAIAGLLSDLGTSGRVGPSVAAFAVAAWLAVRCGAKLRTQNLLFEAVVVALGALVVGLLLSAIGKLTGALDADATTWLVRLSGTALYTGMASVPVLMIQRWFASDPTSWRWRLAP